MFNMRMPSVMKHDFSQVPHADIQRSKFDRSHVYKTTFDAGYLIPVFFDEVLPGDTFNLSMTAFCRLATPKFPFMDNVYIDSFFFYVPNRLIWNNWQKFQGERIDPDDSIDYVIPTVTAPVGGFLSGTLFDYFGVPTEYAGIEVSALWSRAYNLIYNEWFRDQNLIDSVVVDKDDGPDDPADYVVLKRGKRHDYFTSCLPWPQKGSDVALPLGTSAPVLGIGTTVATGTSSVNNVRQSDGTTVNYSEHVTGSDIKLQLTADGASGYPTIYADLSAATSATINDLRESFQIQRLLERDARGGTRYTEILKAHFGVTSPDARLQRPEYLGGGTTMVNINPIAQTSGTSASGTTTPLANLAAIGTAAIHGHGFTKSFVEHGVVIGIVSARADLTYQQGLNRMWSRQTRYDFYMPVLAHLGEQEVLRKEIYAIGTANDDIVFGYQERWAEYRYKPSCITGQFRSNFATSLDAWHLSQDFSSAPVLDETFINEDPPIDRVIAVPSYPHFLGDFYFKLITARPMPMYSVPGLIDHF